METKLDFAISEKASEILGSGSANFKLEGLGPLLIQGATQQEYLQRQTSNNLDLLDEGKALGNTLPNPSGRVLEVFTHFTLDGGIGLLTEPGRAEGVLDYFAKRIFFNDEVEISDRSGDWQVYWYAPGSEAKSVLDKELGEKLSETGSLAEIETGGMSGMAMQALGNLAGGGRSSYLVLTPQAGEAELEAMWETAGTKALSREEYRALRVLSGWPGAHELSGRFTPFELGLESLVSAEKGCYTGQEVLARQITHDKVNRGRALLRLEAEVEAGSAVLLGGQQAGEMGSGFGGEGGEWLGLGVLKRKALEAGVKLSVRGDQGEIGAEIVHIFGENQG